MNKLKVIKNFNQMEVGDIYQFSDEENGYVCEVNRDDSYLDARTGSKYSAKSSYKNVISANYAQKLIDNGYLTLLEEPKKKEDHVNVFDEMKTLLDTYMKDLGNLDENYKDQPACVKLEAETVLANMIRVLNHLLTLKR